LDVKTLGTELGYNGHLKIRIDHIQLPNGFTFKYDYVDTIRAVLILPILGDQIVMIRQYRHAVKREVYDLPGGGVEADESFEAAARRELLEEAGYTAQDLHSLGTFHHAPGCMDSIVHLFAATGLTPGIAQPEVAEILTPITVPLVDFDRMIETEPMEAAVPLAYFLARRKGLIAA
jgi:ADP-ribose pyrophosphatase